MISLTIFHDIFDNKTDKAMSFKSFAGFERFLYGLSKQPGYKPKKGERDFESRRPSPLISPASYKQGTTRANLNVVQWNGWAAMDVDEYEGTVEDALKVFSGYQYVCYSTASSTKEKPKFRVVLPCSSPVSAEQIRHFWYAMNSEFGALGDKQTKDLSRMYYIPAKYPNAHNFIFSQSGKVLNPYEITAGHPYVAPGLSTTLGGSLPSDVQMQIAKQRWNGLGGSEITWKGLMDCPFVNHKLVNEYQGLSSGWYSKMYSIMLSIASNAIRAGYQIHRGEIVTLCKELDAITGNWYRVRAWDTEAQRAIDYALLNCTR